MAFEPVVGRNARRLDAMSQSTLHITTDGNAARRVDGEPLQATLTADGISAGQAVARTTLLLMP